MDAALDAGFPTVALSIARLVVSAFSGAGGLCALPYSPAWSPGSAGGASPAVRAARLPSPTPQTPGRIACLRPGTLSQASPEPFANSSENTAKGLVHVTKMPGLAPTLGGQEPAEGPGQGGWEQSPRLEGTVRIEARTAVLG